MQSVQIATSYRPLQIEGKVGEHRHHSATKYLSVESSNTSVVMGPLKQQTIAHTNNTAEQTFVHDSTSFRNLYQSYRELPLPLQAHQALSVYENIHDLSINRDATINNIAGINIYV